MRCLVTGVAGFIGSHIAARLLEEGHEVCGIDAFVNFYSRDLKERNLRRLYSWDKFTFIEADLVDMDLSSLLSDYGWVFHQAAQAGVRSSWANGFTSYVHHNILATQKLLEAAKQAGTVERFIYASSSSVYGNLEEVTLVEEMALHPYSPYGVTKLAGEHLCSLYYQNFGVPTVSLRYFTVYGPGQRPDMAFHRFLKAIIMHEPIHIYGDGSQTRDFTYVADIVDANIQAAKSSQSPGKVMNIAGGSHVTLQEVIRLLREITNTSFTVLYEPVQHGDVRHTLADTQTAALILGYQPHVSLHKGLELEFQDLVEIYGKSGSLV
jgi:nucleoside-diphosphate-sugar epimerase